MATADPGSRRLLLDAARRLRERRATTGGPEEGLRIVVAGKGGVGKTSLAAVLARLLARRGLDVLAVDADPQMNLAYALGLPPSQGRAIVPLSGHASYVEEKTGARPGEGWGLLFRLNPDVTDVVERFALAAPDGVRLLVMGGLTQAAAGCLCPENSLVAAVVDGLSLRRGEAIVMDTQAGVEHFGRSLARGFHHALVVADPTFNALEVAATTARLAGELGIPGVHLVINRVRHAEEMERARLRLEEAGGWPGSRAVSLPYDEGVLRCEPSVGPLLGRPVSPFVAAAATLADTLVPAREEVAPCES